MSSVEVFQFQIKKVEPPAKRLKTIISKIEEINDERKTREELTKLFSNYNQLMQG